MGSAWARQALKAIVVLLATIPTSAMPQSPKEGLAPTTSTVAVSTGGVSTLASLRLLVESENACAMPGVSIKYDSFIPAMWRAVATGHVQQEHAQFVAEGLRWGFMAGVQVSKLAGHRWFRNYPSAIEGREAVTRATLKRVQEGKTIDLGIWSDGLGKSLKESFKASFIFPMGAVPKQLESDELRPTSDHTRTGLNAATDLSFLKHSLNTYNEIAWFLKQDYFLRVSDVEAAFPMLPLHPDLWPFFLFKFFASDSSNRLHLFAHVCGDFGAAGMPGVFKMFFVDVVVQMARSFQVLTLPMGVYVDDCGLIGPDKGEVDKEMTAFHAWAGEVCGVVFKILKDRLANQHNLMLGFWWDSPTLTRTLEEKKLNQYLEMLTEFATKDKLTLREMQMAAGRLQRAIMTLPPGAACLLVSLFTLMAGLVLPWHMRRTNRVLRSDLVWLKKLLSLNLGKGFYSYDHFEEAPMVLSDASKSSEYTGGGWVSQCGRYSYFKYGSKASRKPIDFLEGDTVVAACEAMRCHWFHKRVPFGIDNKAFQSSLGKHRSKAPRLNNLIRQLFALQLKGEFLLDPFWLSSEDNFLADHLSRNRERFFLEAAWASGFWKDVQPLRLESAGQVRTLESGLDNEEGAVTLNRFTPLQVPIPRPMGMPFLPAQLTLSELGLLRRRPAEELGLGVCASNPMGNSASHNRSKCGSGWRQLLLLLVLALKGQPVGAVGSRLPFNIHVPYDRASLFEGLPLSLEDRLEKVLDNRLSSSSWRTVKGGLAKWREVADRHGWGTIIPTGDSTRGGKLVTLALSMVDETDLVYSSIEGYIWGFRTWLKFQRQADPVYGIMGWDDFMSAIKVLTWVPAEPRKSAKLPVLRMILESTDQTNVFEVQLAFLLLILLYTFSRSECPCPKTLSGRESFDQEEHWTVDDFDLCDMEGKKVIRARFKKIKQDKRMERPEARGEGDWSYVAQVANSIFDPVFWLLLLTRLRGPRPSKKSPFFVHKDGIRALTYSVALEEFKEAQRKVGVADEDLVGLHGLRVLGYNQTKNGLGADLAQAHGLWGSDSHERYGRFRMARVLRISGVIAEDDPGDQGQAEASEREAGPPDHRLSRGTEQPAAEASDRHLSTLLPPGWDASTRASPQGGELVALQGPEGQVANSRREAWAHHDGFEEPDSWSPERGSLPEGWAREVRCSASGRRWSVFHGPQGERASSSLAAWRAHQAEVEFERMEEGSPLPAQMVLEPPREVQGEGQQALEALVEEDPEVVGPSRESVSSIHHTFPEDMSNYIHYHDRPSGRKAPAVRRPL